MMKLGTETNSLVNHLYSRSRQDAPAVGMGATILGWTDRYAGTIIAVEADGSFTVQRDTATRADSLGMSDVQRYEYTPDPHGITYRFAPCKRGKAKGEIRENGLKAGRSVIVGRRDHHYDYSF